MPLADVIPYYICAMKGETDVAYMEYQGMTSNGDNRTVIGFQVQVQLSTRLVLYAVDGVIDPRMGELIVGVEVVGAVIGGLRMRVSAALVTISEALDGERGTPDASGTIRIGGSIPGRPPDGRDFYVNIPDILVPPSAFTLYRYMLPASVPVSVYVVPLMSVARILIFSIHDLSTFVLRHTS